MTCSLYQDLLQQRLDGVGPEASDDVRRHLAECPECRALDAAAGRLREGLRLLQESQHNRLLEKWLIEGLTKKEEAELPPELLERAKTRVRGLIDKGLAEARAGLLVDGPETMQKLKGELRSRRRA